MSHATRANSRSLAAQVLMKNRFKADGFLARVIQAVHEIDHTNRILFVDHIQDDKDAFYELDEKGELRKLDYEGTHQARSDLFDD